MSFDRFVLDNGLVVTFEKRQGETTAMLTGFRTGAKYENKQNAGITHFLEHMMMKSTKKYKERDGGRKIINEKSGYTNAYTSYQRMAVIGEIITKEYNTLFDVEKEAIKNALIEQKLVKNERGVILDEFHRYVDNYDRFFYAKTLSNMFKTGLNNPILGNEKSISTMNNKKLKEWRKKMLVPNNMIISIVGNANKKQALKKIEKEYGSMKNKKIPKPNIKFKKPSESIFFKEKVKESKIGLSVFSPNPTNDESFAFDLLSIYLRRKMFEEARTKKGLTYGFNYMAMKSDQESFVNLHASCSLKNLSQMKKIMEKEVEKVINGKIDNKLFKISKKSKRFFHLVNGQKFQFQVSRLFDYERMHIFDLIETYPDFIDKVTQKQMSEVANKYFEEDKRYWTIIKPAS